MPHAQELHKGLLLSTLAMLLFCISDAVIKYFLGGYTVYQTMAIGFLGAAFLSFVHLLLKKISIWQITNVRTVAIFSGLYFLEMLCFFGALHFMDFSVVFIFVMTIPLIAAKLAQIFLKEPLSLRQHLALATAFLGVVVVVLGPHAEDKSLLEVTVFGVIFGILDAFLCASKMVFLRKYGASENTNVMSFWSLFLMGLGGLLLAVCEGMPLLLTGDIVWLGLFPLLGFIGTLAYVQSYKLAPATMIAPVMFTQLLWATLIGALFFKEDLSVVFLAGAALMAGAGILFYWPVKKQGLV